jgi:hypothetical protein
MILAECNNVQLLWVPEQKRIEGNETADQLARKGSLYPLVSRLGGVVVSVLPLGQRLRVRNRPRRWIFKGDKNPQHIFLSDGK